MSEPMQEPGWEVVSGVEARKSWGEKDHRVHEFWDDVDNLWLPVGWSKNFNAHTTYRRRLPVSPLENHFI